jgi:hypothetical protein
VVLAK